MRKSLIIFTVCLLFVIVSISILSLWGIKLYEESLKESVYKEQLADNLNWNIKPSEIMHTDDEIKGFMNYGEISVYLNLKNSHTLRTRKGKSMDALVVQQGSMQNDTDEKMWDKWECVAYVLVPEREDEFVIENDDLKAVALLKYSYPSNPFWGEPSIEGREKYFDKYIVNRGFITKGVIDDEWFVWEKENYPDVKEITQKLSEGFDKIKST